MDSLDEIPNIPQAHKYCIVLFSDGRPCRTMSFKELRLGEIYGLPIYNIFVPHRWATNAYIQYAREAFEDWCRKNDY